jgi:hypothetical protein
MTGVHNLSSSTSTVVVLLSASERTHKMSTRSFTFYKYVEEHHPIPKEYRGAGEYHVDNRCYIASNESVIGEY